jgi:predicted NAD/FAD-dependent oxidoreductase
LKVNQRRRFLLFCASEQASLETVNKQLKERILEPICEAEWNLWVNFYYPIAEGDPLYEKEIVCNDRPLAWLARDLKKRNNKKGIS